MTVFATHIYALANEKINGKTDTKEWLFGSKGKHDTRSILA
jgi:hypothetical protein